jgi:hypothetical protein
MYCSKIAKDGVVKIAAVGHEASLERSVFVVID